VGVPSVARQRFILVEQVRKVRHYRINGDYLTPSRAPPTS
jgi:hypothetical protein